MHALPIIAVVTQETRLEGLTARWATKGAARFRLKQAHIQRRARRGVGRGSASATTVQQAEEEAVAAAEFGEYEQEDATYRAALKELRRQVDFGYPIRFLDRRYLPTFNFGACVVVVVIGRDGLVANTAKYAKDLPIIAINPDPARVDGILLPFEVRHARGAVRRALEDKAKTRDVTLAQVDLNDGQQMLAFNDFFAGCASHVSARYTLTVEGRSEPQSSSGMIISTGAGSSGWLSSMCNMANGFARWLGDNSDHELQMSWEDRQLVWVVREPFRSKRSGADLVAGFLTESHSLVLESLMPTQGVIFSDGIESDFLEFNSGTIATFSVSDQRARLVVG